MPSYVSGTRKKSHQGHGICPGLLPAIESDGKNLLLNHSEPKLRIPFGNCWAKLRPVQYVSFIFEKVSSMICHLNGPMLVETFKNTSVM